MYDAPSERRERSMDGAMKISGMGVSREISCSCWESVIVILCCDVIGFVQVGCGNIYPTVVISCRAST